MGAPRERRPRAGPALLYHLGAHELPAELLVLHPTALAWRRACTLFESGADSPHNRTRGHGPWRVDAN